MSTTNTIVIVGATGVQGRSVVKAFLQLQDWHVRGITRDISTPTASALTAQGVEMVQADLSDPPSLDKAFEGVDVIFLNTDFWGTYATALKSGKSRSESSKLAFDTEVQQAKNAIHSAAKLPNLCRLVYSALGPMNKASNGKYSHSGHWESKASVVSYIETSVPELAEKTQFVYPAAYHTNAFLLPKQYPQFFGEERTLLLPGSTKTSIPVIDLETTFGLLVRSLILNEEAGVKLFAYECDPGVEGLIEAWKQRTGTDARFIAVPLEKLHEVSGLPYEVLDGAGFLSEYHYMAAVEGKVIEPKDLKSPVEMKTWAEMLESRSLEELLGAKHNAR